MMRDLLYSKNRWLSISPLFLFYFIFIFYEATVCKNGAFFASWYSVLKKKKGKKKREKKWRNTQPPFLWGIWLHRSYSWNSALATSNTSHSIQNYNYPFQFHLWNRPSVSVRSPSTLYSSKTITICIWHTNLCHPPCKHKNIWWKIFFLRWPICLEQFASNTPPLWFCLHF